MAHIGFELVIRRLWDWLHDLSDQAGKRKRGQRLALADDGEIEIYSDDDVDDLASGLVAGKH